jgi:CO/xanthine dehydrogenase FAD-binding subunit
VIGIAGEELTVFGLDFLVEVNKWMEGKVGSEVFVAGGGNVAMDVAITAKRLGAKKVTLACLEPRDRMPASSEEVARAEEEGVVILNSWGLSRVIEENGVVKGMELKRCVSPWDEEGRFNPQYDECEKMVVDAENILMAVGQNADLSFLGEKYQMQLNQHGLIDVSEETLMTSREGVFAAGDVTTGPGTVIGAIATGRRVAKGINSYLGVECTSCVNKDSACYISNDPEGILKQEALQLKELDAEKRRLDLEDSFTPTAEEALEEARRCLNCGCYAVHPSDIAPALIALNGRIVTDRRTINAEDFFTVKIPGNTVLNDNEIITEIQIPTPPEGSRSTFIKMAIRKSIDFPIVNCAVLVGGESPRICLNAVAPKPYRAVKAEKAIEGKEITEETAEAAGAATVEDVQPFADSRYKVQIAKTLVKRALLAVR